MTALLLLLQQVVVDWGVRPIDILMTMLLAIIGALSVWVLRTLIAVRDDTIRLKKHVGLDEDNGHSSVLKQHAQRLDAFEEKAEQVWTRLERMVSTMVRRLDRLEQHTKLPYFRESRDDQEDET